MKSIEGEAKYANFLIPMEAYTKFKIMAATKGMSMTDMYRRACEEFLEKHKDESQPAYGK